MPKEVIYSGSSPGFLLDSEGGEWSEQTLEEFENSGGLAVEFRQRIVDVRWNRKGHVEIGTVSVDAAEHQVRDGVFMTLDREAINRLIRTLRRARDNAFGADA